jgi:hypothetical protein
VDNAGNVAIDPGGVRLVSYVESRAPGVDENWVSGRAYLNQRALPDGDRKCGAASMAMLLAMNDLIRPDHRTLAAKANEMYPHTVAGGAVYVYRMRDELRQQGAESDYHADTVDQAWDRIRREIDAGRPVIVRTAQGVMTRAGHFFVVVGYRQSGTSREVISYDPYGRWLGTVSSYDRNTTDPSSYKGRWVRYDFDTVYGGYLITAHSAFGRASQPHSATMPSTPPDEVSDEPKNTGTYEGIRTIGDAQILLPLLLNRR